MKLKQLTKRVDFFLLVSIFVYLVLLLPFFDMPAVMDATHEQQRMDAFYKNGLKKYLELGAVHPPAKAFIVSILYHLAGENVYSYNSLGLLIGLIGIIAMYGLGKRLFNRNVGLLSAFLLATYPLFLANAIHGLTDFLITNLIIVALYFYSRGKIALYLLIGSIANLTKEPAIILTLSIGILEGFILFKDGKVNIEKAKRFVYFLVPLIPYITWVFYVKSVGAATWNEYIFSETKDLGVIKTIIYNVLTLNFFHEYAKNYRLQLFYLNFNWVYWLISFLGFISVIFSKKRRRLIIANIKNFSQITKTNLSIILFFLGFFFTMLTFQLWQTPRYLLPVFPFLMLTTSLVIIEFFKKNSLVIIIFFTLLFSTIKAGSIFYSIDPISEIIWFKKFVVVTDIKTYSRYKFYKIKRSTREDDTLVYNLQYLFFLRDKALQMEKAR